MPSFELKVPPPIVCLCVGVLMWLVQWAVPASGFEIPARTLFAAELPGIGVVIIFLGIFACGQAQTTINPMKPETASSLVTSGIYKLSRNPMYLGLLFILAGWGVFLSNAIAFLLIPGFLFYMNWFQIEPEEKALTSLFGEDYTAYRSRVRRWL